MPFSIQPFARSDTTNNVYLYIEPNSGKFFHPSLNIIHRAPLRLNHRAIWRSVAIVSLLLGATNASANPGSGGHGLGLGGAGASSGGNIQAGGNGGGALGGEAGLSVASDQRIEAALSGGDGLPGSPGTSLQFHGYGGGNGGSGLFVSSPAAIEVGASAQIVGGNGAAGTGGRPGSTNSDGAGGAAGGSGISFAVGGTLVNDGGFIQGGKGGDGANQWGTYNSATGGGGGGAGVEGADLVIVNRGTISGGDGGKAGQAFGAAGAGKRGAAIVWTGGVNNRLQMEAGSVIDGAIWVKSGAAAEIVVGVDRLDMDNAFVFDGTGRINTQENHLTVSGVISGTGSLEKVGDGVLTLSGTNLYEGGSLIKGGTVSTSADANLGASSSALGLDGGTVRVTASYEMSRAVSLGAGGGVVSTDANRTLTIKESISDAEKNAGGSLIKSGAGHLVLAASNNYTGDTDVKEGTVSLSGAGNFSASGALILSGENAVADISLASSDQTIGALSGVANSALELGANSLTFGNDDDFSFAGNIEGSGALIKRGSGAQILSGHNGYTGGTVLEQGRLNITHGGALGTGTLAMAENSTLGFIADNTVVANNITFDKNQSVIDTGEFTGTLAGLLSGAGGLSKDGVGTLVLTGLNTYSGATVVSSGALRTGISGALSADSEFTVELGAFLGLDGYSQRVAALDNKGTVSLLGGAPGTTLTVTGRWEGSGGVLRLGTALGDSASISDQLVLDGPAAVAAGTTDVQVVNLGGLGAQTVGDGIEIISARNGATTTAQTTADAFRLMGGHVDAGAFEYRLFAGDADGLGESWFLRSTRSPGSALAYRRETLLYAALPEQVRQADQAMLGSLYQRVGGYRFDRDERGAAPYQTWGRFISADRTVGQSGTVSPTSSGRFTGFQIGSDLWGNADWRFGGYVGKLDGRMSVSGRYGDFSNPQAGATKIQSQYAGAYGTWRSSEGAYVDAAVQQGFHRNSVKPGASTAADSKSRSSTVSIETGLSVPNASGWTIEPQLQVVRQTINLNDSRITAANVELKSSAGWLGRAGLRSSGEMNADLLSVRPYMQANLYKFGGGADVARFIGPAGSAAIKAPRRGSNSELLVGASMQLSPKYSVHTELGKRWSLGGDTKIESALSGNVGVTMSW